MSKGPENKGWGQDRNNETKPLIRYIKRIEGEGLGLYVGLTNRIREDMLARDFTELHQANIWDFIALNEDYQSDLYRPSKILETASSALKPGGILDFQGYVDELYYLEAIDEVAESLALDKISSEVILEYEEVFSFRMTWQKREKEKLLIKRSVSLLLSTLMER